MKFNADKKEMIVMYMLEKIFRDDKTVIQSAADAFHISKTTAIHYLKELSDSGIVKKTARGTYKLENTSHSLTLLRENGDFSRSEDRIFESFVLPLIADAGEEAKAIWSYAFSEILNNALDHSEANALQIVVTYNFFNTAVTITDDGVGIFSKIRKHFGLETLDDARCELFKGKVTTNPAAHSGEGIFFSSKLVDRFSIMSDGLIFATDKYAKELHSSTDSESKGTTVYMELSNRTKRKTMDVFNSFSDEDMQFTKTILKIAMIFDMPPVSRSQAKRMCNGLEKFKEVTLDFSGVDFIGQGFAHQVFVLYRNSHPEVKLMPVNMSQNVEMMLKHVSE